jgi:hypothetical protein
MAGSGNDEIIVRGEEPVQRQPAKSLARKNIFAPPHFFPNPWVIRGSSVGIGMIGSFHYDGTDNIKQLHRPQKHPLKIHIDTEYLSRYTTQQYDFN